MSLGPAGRFLCTCSSPAAGALTPFTRDRPSCSRHPRALSAPQEPGLWVTRSQVSFPAGRHPPLHLLKGSCSSLLPLSALSVSAPPASPAILILLTGPKDQTLRLSRACLSRLPTVPRFLFLLAAKPQPFPLAFSCNVLVNCVCLLRFFTRLVKCQSKFCVPLDTVQCGGDAEINTISLLGNSLDLEGSAAELCSGSVDLICWGTRLTLGARTALGAMGQLPAGWTRQRAAPRLHSWTRDPQDRDRRLSTSV